MKVEVSNNNELFYVHHSMLTADSGTKRVVWAIPDRLLRSPLSDAIIDEIISEAVE